MELLQSTEIKYLIMFFVVLIIPKVLLRFKIPSGITCLVIGVVFGMGLGWFHDDQLVLMLSRLGITSLFLFAGLEIELDELIADLPTILKSIAQFLFFISVTTFALSAVFDLNHRVSLILTIGLFTPSTGFILNSLGSYNFSQQQVHWIRSKAISQEIVAILLLFMALQTEKLTTFVGSTIALVVLVFTLPYLFKLFIKKIAPYAPNSEVSFLVLIAFVSGVITKKIGTYYLVGAFIVGIIAGQYRHFMDGKKSENIIASLAAFFSIFVPFYFFNAGLSFTEDLFTLTGLLYGVLFLIIFIPIRIFSFYSNIFLFLKKNWTDRFQISFSLIPTLIFGLVITGILRDRYDLDPNILSGLIVYTIIASIIPAIVFRNCPTNDTDISTKATYQLEEPANQQSNA